MNTDLSRWTPQPRAAGVTYISAEAKALLDLSESRVQGLADEATWDMATSLGLSPQLTTGAVLDELVQQGHDIVVCTADLGRPTQVIGFGRKYPDRYFNFGIAERNMIGAAAGLATTGHIPVISNYSFFLALMGVENIRNDICYPGLNVRMIGTHSGIAMGFYGTSHHCNEDIGALRAIAGLVLMAPCDGNAIRAAFSNTITHDGPVYFRAGRGREKLVYETPPPWRIGGSNTLREGQHVLGEIDGDDREACGAAAQRDGDLRGPGAEVDDARVALAERLRAEEEEVVAEPCVDGLVIHRVVVVGLFGRIHDLRLEHSRQHPRTIARPRPALQGCSRGKLRQWLGSASWRWRQSSRRARWRSR